jgi:23S rRNA (guanosine2251-2'-O)-methyltransferase
MKKEIILIINNIRSVYNTGSIFRTADGAGISKIYICGTTPTPVDRFGRNRYDFHKVALGAEKSLLWEKMENVHEKIIDLKKKGFCIIVLEQNKNSIDYKSVKLYDKLCIVLGNEVNGVPEEILNLADIVCEIKMMGKKESLNVSVAFGIFIFRLLNI